MEKFTKYHTMARNKLHKACQSWISRRYAAEFDGCSDQSDKLLQRAVRAHGFVQAASIDHTTDIRVQAGDREAQRRVAEEKRRQDRLWRLQEEAVASNKANAAVEMKWSDLKYHNMPQELNEVCEITHGTATAIPALPSFLQELEKQRSACARIAASKDQLIREFMVRLAPRTKHAHLHNTTIGDRAG